MGRKIEFILLASDTGLNTTDTVAKFPTILPKKRMLFSAFMLRIHHRVFRTLFCSSIIWLARHRQSFINVFWDSGICRSFWLWRSTLGIEEKIRGGLWNMMAFLRKHGLGNMGEGCRVGIIVVSKCLRNETAVISLDTFDIVRRSWLTFYNNLLQPVSCPAGDPSLTRLNRLRAFLKQRLWRWSLWLKRKSWLRWELNIASREQSWGLGGRHWSDWEWTDDENDVIREREEVEDDEY